jgi:predicted RNase H-like nuclease (RuvC/YqgF family)
MSGGLPFSNITSGNFFNNLSTESANRAEKNQISDLKTDSVERLNLQVPGRNGGDKVTISEEGKGISLMASAQNKTNDSSGSAEETIQKRIEELKKEIEEIRNSNLPEEEKQRKIQQKTSELVQLVNELAAERKQAPGWLAGTECQGFGGSIS